MKLNTQGLPRSILLLAVATIAACGGGTEPIASPPTPSIKANVPAPAKKASTVTGGSGVAIHMYQALYGMAPSNALLVDYAFQSDTDAPTFAKNLTDRFAATSHADLAKLVLDNLGVTPATVPAVNGKGESEYALLLDAMTQIFGVYPTMRGQVLLNLTNLFAGLEGDATYGAAAISYNDQASSNLAYSSKSISLAPKVIIKCQSPQIPNSAGEACLLPLLSSTSILLPDLRAKFETLCGQGKSALIQNGLAVNMIGHKDGKKDLLFTLWCGMNSAAGKSITSPTINGAIAFIQNSDGSFRDGTKELFGVELLDIGGIPHYAATGDFNNDGYDDFVFSVSREDGRDWSIDHALNGVPPAFLTSNASGKYLLEKKGTPEWGYGAIRIDNEFGGQDVLVAGEIYDVWRFTDSWKVVANYAWATPRTYFFRRSAVGEASRIAVVGENSGKQLTLYTRENRGAWNTTSNFSLSTPNPPVATWISWNGQVGQQTITKIDDKDYTSIYFESVCELRPTKSEPLIAVSAFAGYQITGGYTGQVLIEGKEMTSTTKLMAFSIVQGKLERLPLVVRNEQQENIALYGIGMKCADFNGDGFDDLIMITAGQKPIIYLNDGAGSFDRVDASHFPNINNLGAVVNVYDDIDGDGIPDLLLFSAAGVADVPREVQFPLYRGLRRISPSDK